MSHSHRIVTWTAERCRHVHADVYIGIAPGLEIKALHEMLGPTSLHCYKHRELPLTSSNHIAGPITLFLLGMRRPEIVTIHPLPDAPALKGFERVRMIFDPNCTRTAARAPNAANPIADPGNGPAGNAAGNQGGMPGNIPAGGSNGASFLPEQVPPVVAFLMTIGLQPEDEDRFFNHVVEDFLSQSWSSMPKLLRDIGCTAASEAA